MTLSDFNPDKAIQASAALLRLAPRSCMTRMRLLKLLYIADREHLKAHGQTITGDHAVAMEHGPVLSVTYNLIKGQGSHKDEWANYFASVGPRNVHMLRDPGDGQLSNRQVELLRSVFRRFRNFTDKQLRDYCHDFEEYKKNDPEGPGMRPIPFEDLLQAIGMADKKDALRADEQAAQRAHQKFAAYKR